MRTVWDPKNATQEIIEIYSFLLLTHTLYNKNTCKFQSTKGSF